MRNILMAAVCLTAIAATTAQAASERTLTGVAIGAGAGALVLGPIGAVAGGVVGGIVGGPKISRSSKKTCWYERDGSHHCRSN
jgi:hypothetical protein